MASHDGTPISKYEHRDHIKHANGYEFVLCWHLVGTTWMDFAAFYVGTWTMENVPLILSNEPDAPSFDDNEELTVEGFIKWDGCCEYQLGQQGQIHCCGYEHAIQIGEMIAAAYHKASEDMPGYDADLAGYPRKAKTT